MRIPLVAVLAAVVIHILWGANPVAVKMGLESFPPLWSAFFRFAIGVGCITIWALAMGTRLWPENWEWTGLFILALWFMVQIGLMNIGIKFTSGASAAIMTATYPLFSGIFAHFFIAGDRLDKAKIAGLLIAFLGVGLVLSKGQLPTELSQANFGDLILLVSAILLGGRMIYTAKLVRNIEPMRVVLWQMLLSLGGFATGAFLWEEIIWREVKWVPLGALLYQGVVIAGLAFMVNAWLIKRYSPSVMVSFGFISPISGVVLSAMLLGDTLTWDLAMGTAGVGIGLLILTRRAYVRPQT